MNKKILSSFIVLTFLLSSCWESVIINEDKVPSKKVTSYKVKKDFFSENIKLIWKVSPIIETPISSLVWWIIKNINAEVGKEVKVGQLLAQIDLSTSAYWTSFDNANIAYNNSLNSFAFTQESIKNDLESARIQLENAKTSRENAYITTEKQLELAKTQLTNINKNLSNTEIVTGESIKNANLMLENAKTNLDNFNKNSENQLQSLKDQEKSTYDDIKVAIDNSLTAIDSAITQADMIIGITDHNKAVNDSYETYLSAKNPSLKIKSENSFREAKEKLDKLQANKDYSTNENISATLNDMVSISEITSAMCDTIVLMLDNSIVTSTFTQAQIDWLKVNWLWTWIVTKQSTVNSIKWALISAKNWLVKLNNATISAKTTIETTSISLKNAINIAQTQLDNIKAWNNTQLDNMSGNQILTKTQLENTSAIVKQTRDTVDNALKIAQANYDSINAKLNSQRIQAKSQIDNAKWWKDLAWIGLNNTSIVAPFNWIITARNIEVGTMVNPWTPAFMIWDNSKIKIKLDVNSDNITYLKLNQEAYISKWDNTFTWTISLLSPAADPVTKMFKAEINIASRPDFINLWDFVDVNILKEKTTEKILMVPFSSVISLGQWEFNIFVINSKWIAQSRRVKIWMQNAKDVEIISWLKEWEKVIISWALNIQDWDLVND